MGRYLGSWKLDDIIYVPVVTSSFTTGAATDSDAAPTWRMYEDNNATPVTTGSFAVFDTANSAGLAVAAITLAAAIGYEKGRSYSLYVQATVGGVVGADVYALQIEAEVDANSLSASVVSLAAGAITAGTITDGALTSPKFGAGFITAGSITDGALTSAKFGAGFITAGSFTAGAIGSTALATSAVDEIVDAVWAETAAGYTTAGSMGFVLANVDTTGAIVDAVWDEPKAGHTTADTYGEYLDATVSGIGAAGAVTVGATAAAAIGLAVWQVTRAAASTAGTFGEGVASVQGSVTGSVASVTNAVTVGATAASAIAALITANSIGAVTVGATAASAIAALVTAGSIGAVTVGATSAAAVVDGVWDEAKADHAGAGTFGDILDITISAVKAKTDLLFAGTGNSIAADIRYVNAVSVTGNGQTGTEWGPGS